MNVVPSVIVINNIHHHRFRRRGNRNAFCVSGEACGFYLMCPEHPSEGLDKPSLMRLLTSSLWWSQGTSLGEISHPWGALCQVMDHVASSGRSGEKSRAPLICHQAPLSMGFPRQEYRNGLPFPPLGDLPNPGIEPVTPGFPPLAGRFFTTSATSYMVCTNKTDQR